MTIILDVFEKFAHLYVIDNEDSSQVV